MLGLSLFVGQAFLYNAVFFTYSLVLSTFYNVSSDSVGYYLIAFAVGNFLGPLLLGRLFDVVGRRIMIAGTYLTSGLMLIVTAWLFDQGVLTASTQTVAWVVIFFFASAGASAAYLTVSEIFPMETRALAIAFFYAVGTGLGGIIGPVLFGNLIATKRPIDMAVGYSIGGGLMFLAGLVEAILGVDAEQKSLEEIAAPLSAVGSNGVGSNSNTPATNAPTHAIDGLAGPYRARGSRTAWAPLPRHSRYPSSNPYPLAEIDQIVAALADESPLTSVALARQVGAKFWGPGRFRTAMRAALASGRVRRVGKNHYAAAAAVSESAASTRERSVR